jgi:hypothetical protein
MRVTTDPGTQEEWTIHVLNIHGVFFERRCEAVINSMPDWRVLSTNYPVEFPPPNGPFRGKESSLDIWARRDSDSSLVLDALIECKKANPGFVNWVFFPKSNLGSNDFRFTQAANTSEPGDSSAWTSQMSIGQGTASLRLANDAREVRGDYLKHQRGDKTKTSNAAIQDAAYQVALATRAIIQEDESLLGKARASSEHPAPPWSRKVYVPIVVTTAELFRVDFSPSATDLGTGEIGFHDVTLVPARSVLYEYALPKHLQFSPADPLAALKTGNTDTFSRLHILVIHGEALSETLSGLFADAP